jgi:DNA invertase Pin-like site-specific DNA recombinase
MKPAIIYTRVSSREQQQEGFSLGAQSKTLREYAGHMRAGAKLGHSAPRERCSAAE